MNTTSSPLFQQITMCSNAIRNRNFTGDSSYQEVMQHLPYQIKDRECTNAELVKASLAYLKKPFVARGTDDRKANVAMYIATLLADDEEKSDLAKEVCKRFRYVDDFYRPMMTKIFKFTICNKRVCDLLDRVMIRKEKNMTRHIDRHFDVEFVEIFFNVMEIVVCREETAAKKLGHVAQPLDDLGYTSNVTSKDMKSARAIIEKHMDDIATKCSPCFKPDELKEEREESQLYPKGGGLPIVSIGYKHVQGDNATISKLQESLMDKDEKGEFLEMMFAIISHASNKDNPVVTYRILTLQSVKDFFLEKVLDKSQEEETRQAILGSDEARELRQKVKSLKEENSSLKEKVSSLQEMDLDLRKVISEAMDSNKSLRNKCEQLELECANVRSLKLDLALTKRNENYLREDRCNLVKKGKLTHKEEEDMIWQGIHGGQIKKQKDNVWSGDELDE